jgi:nucleotide-binding universal stress UspA family protein
MRRVLVGLDLSETTDALIERLPILRDLGVEELVLTHVTHRPSPVPAIYTTDPTGGVGPRLAAAGRLLDGPFRVELSMRSGDPATQLAREARARLARAIVVGHPPPPPGAGSLTHGTIRYLLQRARVPVLAIPLSGAGEHAPGARPAWIVYPTDFSEPAAAAAETAAELAASARIPVRLLHVLDENGPPRDELDGQLSALEASLLEAGAPRVERILGRGVPWRRILDEAASEGEGGVIVMGTRGRGLLSGTLLGSQSRKVLRRCRRPVVFVPPTGAPLEERLKRETSARPRGSRRPHADTRPGRS